MIFQKLRRELRGRLGLWAAVFQSRQELETSRWFPRQVSQKNPSSAWSLSEEASSAQPGKQPALPVHVPGDSTWPQQRWLWWEPAPTAGAW